MRGVSNKHCLLTFFICLAIAVFGFYHFALNNCFAGAGWIHQRFSKKNPSSRHKIDFAPITNVETVSFEDKFNDDSQDRF